jgi:hypothetical protein
MAVCCMLLPHTPYRLPQHYKRHVCGPSCSCKHPFLWISPIFSISFVWIIWVQYANDKLSGEKKCSFHRPVLIFQPTVNSSASDKASSVWTLLVSWGKIHSYDVSTYRSGYVDGYRRWRGYILAPQRNLDLQGFCSLGSHCSLSDRSEQNSSKLRYTVRNVFISHSAI